MSNSYAMGTVIAYWPGQGNNVNGVTVQSGSTLGTSWVTVQGTNSPLMTGAKLTLNGVDAIDDLATLSLIGGGSVTLPLSNQVETVGACFVNGTALSPGEYGFNDYPNNILGDGFIRIESPALDALLLIVR